MVVNQYLGNECNDIVDTAVISDFAQDNYSVKGQYSFCVQNDGDASFVDVHGTWAFSLKTAPPPPPPQGNADGNIDPASCTPDICLYNNVGSEMLIATAGGIFEELKNADGNVSLHSFFCSMQVCQFTDPGTIAKANDAVTRFTNLAGDDYLLDANMAGTWYE